MKLRILFFCLLFTFFSINNCLASTVYYTESLPKWLEMLKSGNNREKKLALHSLWFLEYAEFRKDKNVFTPILDALLKDKELSVRAAAANTLKKIGDYSKGCCTDTEIVPSLIKALQDSSPLVRQEAAKALAYYKDSRTIAPLLSALKDKDPWVRLNAAFSLGELKAPKAVDPLIALLEDDSAWRNKFVQQEAIIALRKIGKSHSFNNQVVVPVLINKAKEPYLRKEIIEILGELRATEAREIILEATHDSDEVIRTIAIKAMPKLTVIERAETKVEVVPKELKRESDDIKAEVLLKAMSDPSSKVRAEAVQQLGSLRKKNSIEALLKASEDGDAEVRQKAADVLANNFNDDRIFGVLIRFIGMYDGENKFLRYAEKTAVKNITKKHAYGGSSTIAVNSAAATELLKALDTKNYNKAQIIRMLGYFDDRRIHGRLKGFLDDPSPKVRQWTVYALGRSGNAEAISYLTDALKDKSIDIKIDSARYLADFQDDRAVEPLMEMLHDSNDKARAAALNALGYFEDPRIPDINLKLLNDQSVDVKIAAINNVARKPDQQAFELIIKILDSEIQKGPNKTGLKTAAISALGAMGDKRAVPILIKAADQETASMAAIKALCLIKAKESVPILIKYLSDDSLALESRRQALLAIGEIGDPSSVEALEQLLYDKNFDLTRLYGKSVFVETIGKISNERAVQILIRFLNSSENFADINPAILQLGKFKSKQAIMPLLKVVGKNKVYSFNVASTLKQYGDPLIVDTVIGYLNDADSNVRKGAIILLGEFRDKKAVEPLKALLEDKDPDIRALSRDVLSKIESVRTPQPQMIDGPGPMPLMRGNDAVFRTSTGFRIMRNGPGQPFEKMPRDRKEVKPEIVTAQPVKIVDIQPLIAKLKDKDANLRREAADGLGDSENIKASEHLFPILKDNNAYVRQAAARALGKLKAKDAVSALIDSTRDSDINVRSFSIWALGEIQDLKAIEPLVDLLLDKEEKIRDQSFDALRKFSDPAARRTMVKKLVDTASNSNSYILLSKLTTLEGDQVILKALEDPEGNDSKTIRNHLELLEKRIVFINDHRQLPQRALKEHKNRDLVLSEISTFIKSKTDNTPYSTINFLGHLKDPKGLPILLDIVNTKRGSDSMLAVARTESSRRIAVTALGEFGDKGASKTLLDILVNANESYVIRKDAAQALGKIGEERAVIPLMDILKNASAEKELRTGAASALGNLKNKKAVELLINVLKDDSADLWLRVSAASALGEIGDEMAIEPLSETIKNPKSHSYLIHAVEIALRKFKDKK